MQWAKPSETTAPIRGLIVTSIAISGTGLYTPPYSISNEELVASYNAYVAKFNKEHAADIAAGKAQALQESSVEFVFKASGIKSRYVVEKDRLRLDRCRHGRARL